MPADCPTAAELSSFLLGRAPEGDVCRVERHVAGCPVCLGALQTLCADDEVTLALRERPEGPPLPEAVSRAIEGLKRLPSQGDNTTSEDATMPPADVAPGAAVVYDFLAPPRGPGELGRLGPYRVLRVLGAGGMGVVFLAEDEALGRRVALKAMLPEVAASPTAKARFLREARSAAKVKHDHIVTIYQVGEDRGVPFLAMELLAGEGLDERLKRGPLPVADVLRIGAELARALAAAHAAGLVHRDVKPANVWLEGEGGRVKVLDFGLARGTERDATLTQHGAIVGTPAYMAPEQVDGRDVGPHSDLFSLGCVLYALCTGRPPFVGKDTLSTLVAVATESPAPPDEFSAEVPAALSALIMRLLAKAPERRPAGAAEVADELARIVPRKAPPAPPRRWGWWAAGAAALLAVVASVVIILRTPTGDVTIETDDPDVELLVRGKHIVRIRHKSSGKSWELDAEKYTLAMADDPGGLTIDVPDGRPFVFRRAGKGLVKVSRVPRPPVAKKPTGRVPLDALSLKMFPGAAELAGEGDPKRAPPELVAILGDARFRFRGQLGVSAYSPDGKRLAVPCGDTVRICDAAKGVHIRTLRGHGARVFRVAYSADGKTVATISWDGEARVWDSRTGELRHSFLGGHGDDLPALAISPDGKTVATSGLDGKVRLWGLADGSRHALSGGSGKHVWSLAFSPDGKLLAAFGIDQKVVVWDVPKGKALRNLEHVGTSRQATVAFSPDGKTLAAGTDAALSLWDTRMFKLTRVETPAAAVHFSADGRTLLTGRTGLGADGAPAFKTWDTATWKEKAEGTLPGRGGWGQYLLSPDGATAAGYVEHDPVLHQYDLKAGKLRVPPSWHTQLVCGIAFRPDGKRIATGSHDHTIRLWDAATGYMVRVLTGHTGPVREVAFSPEGKLLASASSDRTVRLWDAATGKLLHSFKGHEGDVDRVAFSPDGKLLASGSRDNTVRLWGVDARAELKRFNCGDQAWAVAFSPDGKRLAAASMDKFAHVWDVASGASVRRLEHAAGVGAVAFLPDGDTLLTGAHDGWVRAWSLASGEPVKALPGRAAEFFSLAVRGDGKMVAAGGLDGQAHVWDVTATPPARQSFRLSRFGEWVHAVAYSPEGRHLAAAGFDGTVSIYRLAPPGKGKLPGLPRPMPTLTQAWAYDGTKHHNAVNVAISPDGKRAFSYHFDGTAAVFDPASGKLLRGLKHPPGAGNMAATADGKLITTHDDSGVRIWDVESGKEVHRLTGRYNRWASAVVSSGCRVLTTCTDGQGAVVQVDLTTLKGLRRFRPATPAVQFAILPSGRTMFGCNPGDDAWLVMIDLKTTRVVRTFEKRSWVRRVAVSPDGKYGLVVGGGGNGYWTSGGSAWYGARLFNLETGALLWQRVANPAGIWDCAFSPDSRLAAVACYDGTARLYDCASGDELACVDHPHAVGAVAFSPDGKALMTGDMGGGVRMWKLPPAPKR